jgi:hypothetical protein
MSSEPARTTKEQQPAGTTADTARSGPIEGQLNQRERELLTRAILEAEKKPRVAIEVGTWLGGGST